MYYASYHSPVGNLLLECTDNGLSGIYMDRESPKQLDHHPFLQQAAAWLDGYFQGESLPVVIPLDPKGTDFQKQIWKILLTIPYGTTKTYGDIAREIAVLRGMKKMSAQAVGQAVGKNPVNILVPCHRVVGTQGQLTGYGGGLPRKIWLLRHEGHRIENKYVL